MRMMTVLLPVLLAAATFAVFILPNHLPTTMRTTTVLLLVFLTTATSAMFVIPRFLPPTVAPVTIHSQGPTIEKLEKLSQLVTTRVQIADVLVAEGNGCRGSWLIKGDSLLSVNLSQAKVTDKHDDTKQATIILPEPQVLQPRVDHSRTRTWAVDRLTWLPWHADQDSLRDAVMSEAQRLVAYTAASAENIQTAKMTAETVLKALYTEVGWQIDVTWASNAPAGGQ